MEPGAKSSQKKAKDRDKEKEREKSSPSECSSAEKPKKKHKGKGQLVKSLSAADLLEISIGSDLPTVTMAVGDQQRNISDSTAEPRTPTSILEHDRIENREEKKRKQKRFHRLFANVPVTELLVCRFSCAYLNDKGVLIQGHLYVSRNWICFYSNIFGLKKTIQIPYSSVVRISKEKTAKIIPNAVAIQTETQHYFFGSLISRDNTYQLLVTFFEKSRELYGMLVAAGHKEAIADSVNKEDELRVEPDDAYSLSSLGDNSDDELSDLNDDLEPNTAALVASVSVPERKWTAKRCVYWFIRQPRIIMILFLCVVGMVFLFLCAAFLTLRLLYMNNKPDYTNVHITGHNFWLDSNSFERVNSALDSTIQFLHQVRQDLELLRLEFASPRSPCTS